MNKRDIVPESSLSAATSRSSAALQPLVGATFVQGVAARAQLPPPGPPEIAFAGRSNAGKSSAINALARRNRLAFASRTPGRTREINLFRLRSGALIADLPGYGYAAVARDVKRTWQEFVWDYVTTRATLVGLVLVADARHGLKDLDLTLLHAFVPSSRPLLVLATKSDKLNNAQQRSAVSGMRDQLRTAFPEQIGAFTVLPFSATRRTGVEAADAILASWLDLR